MVRFSKFFLFNETLINISLFFHKTLPAAISKLNIFKSLIFTCNSIFRRFRLILVVLWSNVTGKRSLSKVVQRVRNYLQLDFQRLGLILVEIFAVLSMVLICKFTFFLCNNSEINFGTLVKCNRKRSLSKVVQRVRNYLQLDF